MTPGVAIVRRELLTSLRSVKPILFLTVLVLLMVLELWIVITQVIDERSLATRQVRASDVQFLFMTFAMGFYAGAVLLIPPMAALSICIEKQQETFDQLQATYIKPLSLVLAKMGNVLGVYALLLIATLPVMGVAFFLVGIDWTQFVLSLAVIAASAASLAAIGVLFSAWCHRTASAIAGTYIVGVVFHIGIVLALALLAETILSETWLDRVVNNPSSHLVSVLYPLYSLELIRRGGLDLPGLLDVIAYHGLIVATCLYLAVRILRRPARPMRVNLERPIDDPAALDARRKRFPYYLLDPRRRRPLIPDGTNPVYIRELQTSFAGWGVWRIRIAYGFGFLCFALSIHSIWTMLDQARFARGAFSSIMIGTAIALVFVPSAVAFAITRENDSGNADMLRMTLLQPQEIAAGKFRAALAGILPMLAGIAFGTIPLILTGDSRFVGDLFAMLLTIVYTMALVAAVTAGARRTFSALLLGYGAALLAHVVLPYSVVITNFMISPAADRNAAAYMSPFWARIIANYTLRYGDAGHTSEMIGYWFSNALLFILITLGLLWIATWRFQRSFNRS